MHGQQNIKTFYVTCPFQVILLFDRSLAKMFIKNVNDKLVPLLAMKARKGKGGSAPLVLKLGSRWW